jgi:hypothetical protein
VPGVQINPSRENVQQIECPRCGAEPYTACFRFKRKGREWVRGKANHIDRLNAFKDLFEPINDYVNEKYFGCMVTPDLEAHIHADVLATFGVVVSVEINKDLPEVPFVDRQAALARIKNQPVEVWVEEVDRPG